MNKIMKIALTKPVTDEKGQAFVLSLILLLVGALIITPLLGLMSTGLIAGQALEEKMFGLYAADAGIEDAIWKIQNDLVPDDPYSITVNGKDVVVDIASVWILDGIEDPAQGAIPHDDWAVVTRVPVDGTYQVTVTFAPKNPQGAPASGNKRLLRIGVWLPFGFEYAGSSSGITNDDPNIEPSRGGIILTWDWAQGQGPQFIANPAQGTWPDIKTQEFNFTPTDSSPGATFAWVKFQSMDIYLSWDANFTTDTITATATDSATPKQTKVVAHVSSDGEGVISIITWKID